MKASDQQKLMTEVLTVENDAVSPPPPLPPRTRVNSTPPPPLPPRDSQAGGGLSRMSVQYQPVKRNKDPSTVPHRGISNSIPTITASVVTGSSPIAPPSSLEQLAEQTGFTTQQIQEILMQHSAKQRHHQHVVPQMDAASTTLHHEQFQNTVDGWAPAHHIGSGAAPYHAQFTGHPSSAGGMGTNGVAAQPPPPQYSSAHIITSPPPPPYTTQHQPSPASSVTSGSSNDYLHMNYGYFPATGEYRTSAYGESPSSGKYFYQ